MAPTAVDFTAAAARRRNHSIGGTIGISTVELACKSSIRLVRVIIDAELLLSCPTAIQVGAVLIAGESELHRAGFEVPIDIVRRADFVVLVVALDRILLLAEVCVYVRILDNGGHDLAHVS